MICGRRVRVEMSTGRTRHDKDRYGGGGGRSGGGDRYGGERGGYRGRSPPSRGGPPRREYRDSSRRGGDSYREEYRRKRYSRSRSRSATPLRRSGRDGHVRDSGRPRTPPSRSPDSNSR